MINIIAAVQLPPPLNGLTLISASVLKTLRSLGCAVEEIPLASHDATSKLRVVRRFGRAAHAARTYRMFVEASRKANSKPTLYLTISGGIGKLLEVPLVILARAGKLRIVIHHHSFAYLNRWSFLGHLMMIGCGPESVHICLGPTMSEKLQALYGKHEVFVVSNAMFLPELSIGMESCRQESERSRVSIGFLGNIEAAKGIFEFIATIRQLKRGGMAVRGVVAGPFVNADIEARVHAEASDLPEIEFIGKVFAESKQKFFESLDYLLFPTSYVNEAEPVVILEALSYGVIVLSSARGGIADILTGPLRECCFPHEVFVDRATAVIQRLNNSSNDRVLLSKQGRARVESMASDAAIEFGNMLKAVTAGSP